MAKLIALDFGTKRIGYAVSDEQNIVAFPRETLPATPQKKLFARLREIIKEERIAKIILGLPLDNEGEEGASAQKVKVFGEELARSFLLPVEYIDESNSSEQALAKIHLRKQRREKGFRDAIAAQIILQRYLDAQG